MFTIEQLRESVADPVLFGDLEAARTALARRRLGITEDLRAESEQRLSQLVEAVLASACAWPEGEAHDLLGQAGEAAELLALAGLDVHASKARLRGALIYELAAMPMMAGAILSDADGPRLFVDLFKRRGAFGSLATEIAVNGDTASPRLEGLLRLAACQDALSLSDYQHDHADALNINAGPLSEVARHLTLDMSLTDVNAFDEVLRRRARRSTRLLTPHTLRNALATIGFPPELWEGQARALARNVQ